MKMPTDKCRLCCEDVPYDDAGMGQTLLVVHENKHIREKKRLGMTMDAYAAYCRANYPRRLPD